MFPEPWYKFLNRLSQALCVVTISHLFAGLETFIQEYIDQKNKEITEFNNEVRNSAGQFVDLFA